MQNPIRDVWQGKYFKPGLVLFPAAFNLTSHIDGKTLTLENNASVVSNTISLALVEDSYIVGYPGSGCRYTHEAPEFVVVGDRQHEIGTFQSPTCGIVTSFVKLVGESAWRKTQNVVMNLQNHPQTAEESRNLKWASDGTFQYLSGSTDQGITFSPDYHS